MKLILLGKPLSGKGTQATSLAKHFHIPLVSLGDILRAEIAKKSVKGKKIASSMHAGKLVPESIILSLLREYFSRKSFLLDGFPRRISQAKILDSFQKIDLVIDISCPDTLILQRLHARKICSGCGSIYGITMPPKRKDICDRCKGILVQREDDTPAILHTRLQVYKKEAKKLIAYYKKKGIYFAVDGKLPAQEVCKRIIQRIETIK